MNAPAPKFRPVITLVVGLFSVMAASGSFALVAADIQSNFAAAWNEVDGQAPAYILNSPYNMFGYELE